MVKQDLRKIKEQRKLSKDDAINNAESMLGRKVEQNDIKMAENMFEAAKKYEGRSEDELKDELLRAAEQGRRDGTLNNDMLDTFYRSMSPMMSPEQKQRLDAMMKMLKR